MTAESLPPAESRASRLSDLLNPILVREVQQAVKGRGFVFMVLAALLFSVGLATYVASQERASGYIGGVAFSAGLMALAPLVLFVVPMSAFQSMRLELRAGIVEQLLLSRLRPGRIIVGKLAAAMVQYFLYLAVLAPVLATTYLLRGVDVPTIFWCLVFSLVFCVTATAIAVATAAQSILPALQPITYISVAMGLGILTITVMAAIGDGDLTRAMARGMTSPQWSMVVSATLLSCLALVAFSGMLASSLLAHAFENRSTPFRLFLVALLAVALGWLAVFVDPAWWFWAVVGVVIGGLTLLATLGLFFVTEPAALSPRHRTMLPRSPALRLLVAPLMPGRDRGLAFVLLVMTLLGALLWLSWPDRAITAFGRVMDPPDDEVWHAMLFLAAYILIYLLLTKLLRGALPETQLGSNAGRVAMPLLLTFCCIVPLLFDVLIAGRYRRWHPGHVLDPFTTMERFVGRNSSGTIDVLVGLWIFVGVLLLLNGPGLVRGFGEVLAARTRRDLAPPPAAAPAGEPDVAP